MRLEEGRFRHPACPNCRENGRKTYLEPGTRWVRRLRFCDGTLVDFAFVLERDTPLGWRQVLRVSVAHANFHMYQYGWRTDRPVAVKSLGLIDDAEDVTAAYRTAVRSTYPHWREWVAQWQQRR